MGSRNVDITVVSVEDRKKVKSTRKKVKLIGRRYVVVWVDPYYRQSTNIDKYVGAAPSWNQKLSLPVLEHFFQEPNSQLTVQIYRKRLIFDDKLIGAAVIPLSEIARQRTQDEVSTYPVKRRSRKVKGWLRLAIHVEEKMTMATPARMGAPSPSVPVAAHPPMYDHNEHVGTVTYGYPLEAAAAPYGYPPAPHYPQAYGGYGGQGYYPPTVAPHQYYNS